ncbi:outer membrane protein [Rhizobium sp.]
MNKIIFAALFASVSSLAMAADVVTEVAPAPVSEDAVQAFSWNGAYVGLGVGGGSLQSDFGIVGVPAARGSKNFNGGLVSGFVGYNYQIESFVIGVEGDFSYNWNERTFGKLGGAVDMGSDMSGSLRGRVGYAMDSALIYATAGWTATNGYVNSLGVERSRTFQGWTAGAGLDFAVTDNVFLRAEYRYSDFASKNIGGLKIDPDQHTAIIGVGFKF